MLDEYWVGEVTRISPEAPVPCLKVLRQETRPGAAANVAENCKAMGAEVVLAVVEGARKIRLVARNQQIVRADFDAEECVYPALHEVSLKAAFALANGAKTVILSDYGRGVRAQFHNVMSMAKAHGATVLVDPKGHDYSIYAGADMVKPNLDEMRLIVGGWSSEEQLEKKVRALMLEHGIKRVLLTRAAAGMTLFDAEGAYSVPSVVREVYDVTGAGDTAIAAMAVALERGFSWRDSVGVANLASAAVVGKFGTAVATEKEAFG